MESTLHKNVRSPRPAPQLYERLEPRMLLSADTAATQWTGLGDGVHWHDAKNWSGTQVPGIFDDVVIRREPQSARAAIVVSTAEAARSVESNTRMDIKGSLSIARNSRFDAPVTVNGQLSLIPGADSVLRMTELTLGSEALLDVADGTVLINYSDSSPMEKMRDALARGYNHGEWSESGIISSVAAKSGFGAVGYAEAEDLFNAFPRDLRLSDISGTTLIMRYTLGGDANLDRVVDLHDFNRLASGFGSDETEDVRTTWSRGDFNYDGVTNLADFNILAANFGRILPSSVERIGASNPFDDRRGDDTVVDRTADGMTELA